MTPTTASSGPCDRRPARDHVGDPRCCSRWGCNSGRERKPDMQAVVGAGCYPSLLPAISDRQLPADGAMRMPRKEWLGLARSELTAATSLDEDKRSCWHRPEFSIVAWGAASCGTIALGLRRVEGAVRAPAGARTPNIPCAGSSNAAKVGARLALAACRQRDRGPGGWDGCLRLNAGAARRPAN